jgi:hypothetical protein
LAKKERRRDQSIVGGTKNKLQTEITEQLKKNIASDYEHKIKLMQENETKMQTQANEYRQKELDFLKNYKISKPKKQN